MLVLVCSILPFICGATWPSFKNDPMRASSGIESITPPLELKWSAATGTLNSVELRYSSPIVSTDKVFVGSNDGRVLAFKLGSATAANLPLWTYQTDGPIYGTPADALVSSVERVFVGSSDGYLYCLNVSNGSLVWKRNVGNASFASPTVFTVDSKQVVCTASNDGRLYVLKADTGDNDWAQLPQVPGYGFSSPVCGQGNRLVYAVSYNGILNAYQASSGITLWTQWIAPTRSTGTFFGSGNGWLINVATDGTMQIYNGVTGDLLSTVTTGAGWGSSSSSAVVSAGGSSTIVCGFDNGNISAFSMPMTGLPIASLWTKNFQGGFYSSPSISNNVVYVGSNNGNVYALDLKTGNTLQTLGQGAPARVSAAVGQNTLLVSSSNGQLRAYGMPVTGYVWNGPLTVTPGTAVTYTLFATDKNGNEVYAYSGTANLSVLAGSGVSMVSGSSVSINNGAATVVFVFSQSSVIQAVDAVNGNVKGVLSVMTASTPTPTPSWTSTFTPTNTSTNTPTMTPTYTFTSTQIITPTPLPTDCFQFTSKWGAAGTLSGEFTNPVGVAIAPSGYVYVAEYGGNRIQEFSPWGIPVTAWGGSGSGNGQFHNPNGLTVDTNGNVYVADQNNDRIQIFDSNGKFLRTIGGLGSGNGLFNRPTDVVVYLSWV
jgi:outer membrane protein assembly factor BamB